MIPLLAGDTCIHQGAKGSAGVIQSINRLQCLPVTVGKQCMIKNGKVGYVGTENINTHKEFVVFLLVMYSYVSKSCVFDLIYFYFGHLF